MTPKTTLLWLRQDLRLSDHPALAFAAARGRVVPVYILDPAEKLGGASLWALGEILKDLSARFEKLGAPLLVREGNPAIVLQNLIKETGADCLAFSRRYEPQARAQEQEIQKKLKIEIQSFNASLLFEPWEIKTKAGSPFKVFTPFYKACYSAPPPSAPLGTIKNIKTIVMPAQAGIPFVFKTEEKWESKFASAWQMTEKAAQERLKHFIDEALVSYKTNRDRPDKDGTSMLSPFLHFGLLSPRQIWFAVQRAMAERTELQASGEVFLKELLWREFSYHLLFHFPDMPEKPLQKSFARFPWRKDDVALKAWQKGETGYPIVDAGMRQLWQTGWMHNRVRMIVASFLVKDLLLPWQEGESWFWDALLDADLANNAASWQWVAGCGADAAPYFRVFNPVLQGKKFDSDGAYIKRYVPELKGLNGSSLHEPWRADRAVLKKAGVILGKNYPKPLVDHAVARKRALESLKKSKKP